MNSDFEVHGRVEGLEARRQKVYVIRLNEEFYAEAVFDPAKVVGDYDFPEMIDIWLCRERWITKLFIGGREASPELTPEEDALAVLERVVMEGDLKVSDFQDLLNDNEALVPEGEWFTVAAKSRIAPAGTAWHI